MTTETKKENRYFEAVGRRKTASARVRITPASKTTFVINDRDLDSYFPTKELQAIVVDAFDKIKLGQKFQVSIKVSGSGINSQAEAIRLGISRALLIFQPDTRGDLKKLGFLKRDPRAKERRKFGLKKARKSPQWSKR